MKRCQTCQVDYPDSVTFCRTCGQALIEIPQEMEAVVYCPQCGTPAKATWKFCKRCGGEMEDVHVNEGASAPRAQRGSSVAPADVRNAAARSQCPRCHTLLRAEARFCDVCGAALNTPTPVPGSEPTSPHADRVTVSAPVPVGMALGGYADTNRALDQAALDPEERRRFKRLFLVALGIMAFVALWLLIRYWSSSPPAGTGAGQPGSSLAGVKSSSQQQSFFPVSFSATPIEKEDQFAGGHPHAVVTLGEQALFIIRDEAEYHSTVERAQAITDNLHQAIANLQRDPEAEFRIENRPGGPVIVQVMPNLVGEEELPIVTITRSDVAAYNRRSRRSVTATQLAQWWGNRLKDRVDLFVKGERPQLTTDDEDGRILVDLYERAKRESVSGRITAEALDHVVQSLSPEQRRLLSYEGVRTIPHGDKEHDR